MYAIYQVNVDELDQRLLDRLKAMFKNKESKSPSTNVTQPRTSGAPWRTANIS